MSNFMKRTKGDMHYLFNKGHKLSPNGKKRKRRAISFIIGAVLVLFEIVMMILFLLQIFKLDILPLKYLIMLNVILLLITLYNITSQFTRANIIGKILAVLLSIVMTVGYLYANQLSSVLNNISGTVTKTDIVNVIVLANDKANCIKDTNGYTYGYNTNVNKTTITKAIKDIEDENDMTIKSSTYTEWEQLINDLYDNKKIKAIVIDDSTRLSLNETYSDFSTKTKIIGTVEITTKVKLNTADKKVNNESFIVYLSGNDDDGEIRANGRSDVNILAIINPKTRQVLLVSTPRDYYITISNSEGRTGLDKLTHAGNSGIEYSEQALENLFGINIDYFYKINFTGCVGIVDALGGITINSDVAFTNGLEAQTTRYDFVVGPNECDGDMTLAFVRERKAFGKGDLQRGKNQTAAITAIIDKATSPAILTSYTSVLEQVQKMMITNMPPATITALVKGQLANPQAWNVQSYALNGIIGGNYRDCQVYGVKNQSVVLPDYNSINAAIDMINMTYNGQEFNVDEYVESLNNNNSTSTN